MITMTIILNFFIASCHLSCYIYLMSVTHDDDFNFEGEYPPVCGARKHKHNAKSVAAIEEGRAMMMEEVYSKLYKSLEATLINLDLDD